MMVTPFQFGTGYSEYAWEGDGAFPLIAHHDYCAGYRKENSYRLWEPGREALSQDGYYDQGGDGTGPEIPAVTTIHGVKGAMHISFGCADDDLGVWVDDNGDALTVSNRNAWAALTGDSEGNFLQADFTEPREAEMRRSGSIRIPLFAAMYRGTYKAIDANAGWEIDSGPGDDPDTLIGFDITNPSMLESSRLDWWDMDWVPLPRRAVSYNLVTTDPAKYEITRGNYTQGGWHKYSMDLKANKTLAPGQVLWMHFMTGVVKLPVVDSTIGLTCGNYKNHRFSMSLHASMMVTRRTRG